MPQEAIHTLAGSDAIHLCVLYNICILNSTESGVVLKVGFNPFLGQDDNVKF